jgi:hypothetical protein
MPGRAGGTRRTWLPRGPGARGSRLTLCARLTCRTRRTGRASGAAATGRIALAVGGAPGRTLAGG